MFNLDDALENWKISFRTKYSAEDTEELEGHLTDLMEDLKNTGLTEEEAFIQAVSQMGTAEDLKREFAKVSSVGDWILDRFKALDRQLVSGSLLICGMGLAILYSAGVNSYYPYWWIKQAAWMGLGFALMFVVGQITPARLRRHTPVIYRTSLFFLVLVLFVGSEATGMQRWFSFGILTVKPSVFMLLTIPMMTAWLLDKQELVKTPKGFAVMLALIILPAMLIMYQPYFGMALLCLGAGWITIFLSSCRARLVKLTCLASPLLAFAG